VSERLDRILSTVSESDDSPPQDDVKREIQLLYEEMDQYKVHSESICRKIATPMLPYCPSTSFWYDQIHAYRTLIQIKSGKAGGYTDISRAIRFALRKNIPSPRLLTIQQCWDGIKVAPAFQRQSLARTAAGERKTYLKTKVEEAWREGDEATERAIQQRMRHEQDRSMWKQIKKATNKSTGRACLEVQVQEGNCMKSYAKKTEVELAIQREIKARFSLGNSAPIARSLLGHDLEYLANAETAYSIIQGTFPIPADLDEATRMILHEIGVIGQRILEGDFSPSLHITAEDYKKYHKYIRESTSSSPSGLHLGHGKAAAYSDMLAKTHATQMNLVIRSGVHPTRWGTALQVLLEKVAGVCLVEKLRSIQLYEADLNWFMKFIFNDGALNALRSIEYLPEEHFSQKGSTAEDACLDKTLTFDISRQTRTPMAIMSVDAAQCYDRVHHGLMSLVWLALTQNLLVVRILLQCLGDMKIYTRTGYGDSATCFGGKEDTPACGLGQGSKAAPASWVQLSSIFVQLLRQQGLGAILTDPVTREVVRSIGCLFVDDTDLYVLDARLRSALEVYWSAQHMIGLWASLLQATGGAIKTEKSFWCLLDYTCKHGEWGYAPFQQLPLSIAPAGKKVLIPQRKVTDADKTLGVYHCPAGGHQEHLLRL
jgi:hypothetical protein